MEYTVTKEDDHRRLRDVLRSTMKVSLSAMKAAKWTGGILVDGQVRFVDQFVYEGQTIRIQQKQESPVYLPKPYDRTVPIVYEDEWLMVIDKPAPLCSQSSARQPDNTLENMLFSYFHCPADFVYRPLNRLDKGTSGLMVIAKDAHVQQIMQKALHTASFERIYLAITDGIPKIADGVINAPICKEDGPGIRRIISEAGKPSVTHYHLVQYAGSRALLQLRLETGRTHQIRCHLASIGCPVFGDFLYGTESEALPGRFALHSSRLSMIHPITECRMDFSSPLPNELNALLPERQSDKTEAK